MGVTHASNPGAGWGAEGGARCWGQAPEKPEGGFGEGASAGAQCLPWGPYPTPGPEAPGLGRWLCGYPGYGCPPQLRWAGTGEPWAATGSLGGNGDQVRTAQEANPPGPISPHGGHPWLPGRAQDELGPAPDPTKGQPGRPLSPTPNTGSRMVPHAPGVAGSAMECPSAMRPSAGRSIVTQTATRPPRQIGEGSRQARPPPHKGQLGSTVKILPRRARSHGFQPFDRMWLVRSGLGGRRKLPAPQPGNVTPDRWGPGWGSNQRALWCLCKPESRQPRS